MSGFNGTPGPWCVRKIDLHEGGNGVEVVAGDGEVICDNQTYYPQAINPKNAALIAAAPELLEALQYAVDALEDLDMNLLHNVVENGKAAIAKALGEDYE